MAGGLFTGWNAPWEGRPGYIDFGALSPELQQAYYGYKSNIDPTDEVWANNDLKGFFRKASGRAPYAISNNLAQLLRNPAAKASAKASTSGAASGAAKAAGAAGAKRQFFAPGAGSKLSGFYGKLSNPRFDWNSQSGIQGWGKNIGKFGNVVGGFAQGISALKNINEVQDANDQTDKLLSNIRTTSMGNPLLSKYLTASQLDLLRQVNNERIETDFSLGDTIPQDAGGFGKAALGALGGFVTGGIPGAIIQGVGTAANEGLKDKLEDVELQQGELEALLQALDDANMQYQNMKRPNFTGLGIQQRYLDMYS